MLHFECDYLAGAHPKILQRLVETNTELFPGYGGDPYTQRAAEKIRTACGAPDAEVFFLVGGTQTNRIVISSLLHSCEGVIAAATGHVSLHEAGAIEASGHKVLQLPGHAGKLDSNELSEYLNGFFTDVNRDHMVFPGMVYISHPTEYGTLYSLAELQSLSAVCRQYRLPLFVDGARLGYGLMSRDTDVSLHDLAELCDVFYIGGTKVGALCGEAVVFPHSNAPKHFFSFVKQNGALLAKGRLLGIQFDTLFTNRLYFEISRHAIDMAERLKAVFIQKGYELFIDSPTNQQFIILDNDKLNTLKNHVTFDFWERLDSSRAVVRFATSWSTTAEDIDALEKIL